MEHKSFGVAIFGLGRMGQIHIGNILKESGTTLKYAVARSQNKFEATEKLFPVQNCKFLTSEQEDVVFKDALVNVVVIASPSWEHERVIKAALGSGKNVFCEKPISNHEEVVSECYDLAKTKKLVLFCAFQRRFDKAFKAVQDDVVKNRSNGPLRIIKSCSRDSSVPSAEYLRTSGGFFKDSTVHDIDMVCSLAAEIPKTVYAVATSHDKSVKENEDFDVLSVTLMFPSGTIGLIDQSRLASYGYDQRLEVLDAAGRMLKVENIPLSSAVRCDISGTQIAPFSTDFTHRYEEAYAEEMKHFFNVLRGREELIVTGSHTLAVNRIASAALLSALTAQVVSL